MKFILHLREGFIEGEGEGFIEEEDFGERASARERASAASVKIHKSLDVSGFKIAW